MSRCSRGPTWPDAWRGPRWLSVHSVCVSGFLEGCVNVPEWDKSKQHIQPSALWSFFCSGRFKSSPHPVSDTDRHSVHKNIFCICISFSWALWWGAIWFVRSKRHESLDWWMYIFLAVTIEWAQRHSHSIGNTSYCSLPIITSTLMAYKPAVGKMLIKKKKTLQSWLM